MLRALAYRNYRLFFGGQVVSLVGTWITTTATSWLVYRLTGSALLLGLVGFAGQFPAFVLAPFAGIFVDAGTAIACSSRPRRVDAAVVRAGRAHAVRPDHLDGRRAERRPGASSTRSTCPRGRRSSSDVENKEDLGNAIALNSSMVNAARLVGPSIAGVVIAGDERRLVLPDRWRQLRRRDRGAPADEDRGPAARARRRDGARSSSSRRGWPTLRLRPMRSIILLLALVSLVGFPYAVLMPVFATRSSAAARIRWAADDASGCGALVGALWLALAAVGRRARPHHPVGGAVCSASA